MFCCTPTGRTRHEEKKEKKGREEMLRMDWVESNNPSEFGHVSRKETTCGLKNSSTLFCVCNVSNLWGGTKKCRQNCRSSFLFFCGSFLLIIADEGLTDVLYSYFLHKTALSEKVPQFGLENNERISLPFIHNAACFISTCWTNTTQLIPHYASLLSVACAGSAFGLDRISSPNIEVIIYY